MSKITLNSFSSLANSSSFLTKLNQNFSRITTVLDTFLSRDGTAPNQIQSNIDMNNKRLYNLPAPVSSSEPLRLKDLQDLPTEDPSIEALQLQITALTDSLSDVSDDTITNTSDIAEIKPAIFNTDVYYQATKSHYVEKWYDAQGWVGLALKYTDWWETETAIHRWTKPATPLLQTVEFFVVSGGGGGGSSGPAWDEPSTGAGGGGGGVSWKQIAADDCPDELVFVVGKGGTAGGWDVTPVTAPGPPNFPAGQGVIFSSADGGDGDLSAVFDAAVWDALGVDDAARLTAFKALSATDQRSTAIILCTAGKGGLSADSGENIESDGGDANGGDYNRNGSDSAGGSYTTGLYALKTFALDPEAAFYGPFGLGAGGTAGGRSINDGLWDNVNKPQSGILGQVAGAGASPKIDPGNHDGSHGGIFGGGGGGGQAGTPQEGRVLPGGFGAEGVVRVKCYYG